MHGQRMKCTRGLDVIHSASMRSQTGVTFERRQDGGKEAQPDQSDGRNDTPDESVRPVTQ